jgi:hypothetical protein
MGGEKIRISKFSCNCTIFVFLLVRFSSQNGWQLSPVTGQKGLVTTIVIFLVRPLKEDGNPGHSLLKYLYLKIPDFLTSYKNLRAS